MPTSNNYNRQTLLGIVVKLTKDNIGANTVTANLPAGALVVAAGLFTDTAFNGTGTVTGNITDGTLVLVSAQDVKTTGSETVAASHKYYPTGGTITFSLADANSNSTAGVAVGHVSYYQVGRGSEIQD